MWYFNINFLYEEASVGLYNGLTPNMLQAIIWTKDGLGCWHIYALLGFDELRLVI